MKKEVKILKKTVTNGIEKRVVSGKARSCKIVGGKVSEVYDEISKQYLPIKEFQRLYNEKGERLGVENVKNVKEPISGVSQIKLVSEEDIKEDIEIKEDIGIEIEEDKEEIEDADPFNWYVKRVLRRDAI